MPIPSTPIAGGWVRVGAFRSNDDNGHSVWLPRADVLAALDAFIAAPGSMPESARLGRLRSAMAPLAGMFTSAADVWMRFFLYDMLDERPELADVLPETVQQAYADQVRDWMTDDLGI